MQFDSAGLESYIQVEELELGGIWLEFPGSRKLRVRRAGGSNKKFIRGLQRELERFHGRSVESIDREISDAILRRLYAEHVVVDWSGIRDGAGEEVPCTPENVAAFFKAFPELFRDVVTLASEASQFSQRKIDEATEALGEG